jgi:hypothetical protein
MTNPSASDSNPDFLHLLGLLPPVTVEDVKQAYRLKVKSAHPDAGGSVEEFNRVQQAFERALEYAEFRSGRLAWLGAHVEQYAAAQAVVEHLRGLGGQVEIEQIDWLKRSFGDDFAQLVDRIIGLSLHGPQFNDETIGYLLSERRVLERLYWLDLSDSQVTDRGVRMLTAFEFLGRLDLRRSQATERSLKTIEALPALRWIGMPAASLPQRWHLRWRRPKLHFALDDEVCAAPASQASADMTERLMNSNP